MVNEFPDPSNVPILSYHLISVPVVVNVVVPPTHIVSFVNGGNCGAGLLITTNGSEVAVPQYVVEVQEYVPPETRIDCVVSPVDHIYDNAPLAKSVTESAPHNIGERSDVIEVWGFPGASCKVSVKGANVKLLVSLLFSGYICLP